MIDVKSMGILNDSVCPLRETSKYNYGGNDFYMTNSTLSVVNFDLVKDRYIETLSVPETPKSSDAFYVDNSEEMYLIEFKSGKMDTKKIFDVRLKIFDSLLMLTDILNRGISHTRLNLSYVLVYNETKNPFTKDEKYGLQISQSRINIGKYFSKKGKKKFVRFSLERFERLYFKDVFTVTEEEFENDFVKIWSKSDS